MKEIHQLSIDINFLTLQISSKHKWKYFLSVSITHFNFSQTDLIVANVEFNISENAIFT